MKHVKHLECTLCGSTCEPVSGGITCPQCGERGILEVVYDYDLLVRTVSKGDFASKRDFSMWRYSAFLPVEEKEKPETLAVGWTPLYRSEALEAKTGVGRLFVKDDGQNPTGSLKDRASALAVVMASQSGAQTVACASTGNAASSLAGNAARGGMRSVIFVPERTPRGKLAQMLMYGATVVKVKGSYEETYRLSAQALSRWGWYNRNAAVNPYLVEGKKTVSMECCEQMDWEVPDWVAVSVGDGCTVYGVYKGFFDLYRVGLINRVPRILGIQAEGCCPITKAFEKGLEVSPEEENTMADSIAVGVPRNPVKALRAVRGSGGIMVSVSDEDIYRAACILACSTGVFAEPAGAAGLAGVFKMTSLGHLDMRSSVLVMITGNGLKDPDNAMSAAPSPISIEPTMSELDRTLPEDLKGDWRSCVERG
ncbi:MAG: threonine synthase [Bacillota bacterium]